MTHSLYLNWAVKRQYPNIKLDASLTNYKKAVLAYLRSKFNHQGLKMQIEDLSIIVIDKKLIWVSVILNIIPGESFQLGND